MYSTIPQRQKAVKTSEPSAKGNVLLRVHKVSDSYAREQNRFDDLEAVGANKSVAVNSIWAILSLIPITDITNLCRMKYFILVAIRHCGSLCSGCVPLVVGIGSQFHTPPLLGGLQIWQQIEAEQQAERKINHEK